MLYVVCDAYCVMVNAVVIWNTWFVHEQGGLYLWKRQRDGETEIKGESKYIFLNTDQGGRERCRDGD